MAKFLAKIVQGDGSLTVVVDGRPYTISSSHPNYAVLREALRVDDADKFLLNVDIVQAVRQQVASTPSLAGKVTVVDDQVYYNGNVLHNSLSKRILDLVRGGFDFKPMALFLENLLKNPSKRAVDELYSFLEKRNLPITDDGCFIAYKAIRDNWLDKHSGTFSNKPGAVLEMARNNVDDDAQRTCSYGFHVGALEYSGPNGAFFSHGDKCVLVKVNPADAVSVPADHDAQKLRVCKYEVIGEYKAPLNKPVYSGKGINDVGYDNSEYTEDDNWSDDDDVFAGLHWNELEEGDEVEFDYVDHNGVKKHRYLAVEEVDTVSHKVNGTLLYPEDNQGEYRSFKVSNMTNIYYLQD